MSGGWDREIADELGRIRRILGDRLPQPPPVEEHRTPGVFYSKQLIERINDALFAADALVGAVKDHNAYIDEQPKVLAAVALYIEKRKLTR